MYSEQDFADISRQLKERLIVLGIPAALMLAGIVTSVVFRVQWLTMLLTAAEGFFCLFAYHMLLWPVIAYRSHLNDVLHGRVHTIKGAFKEMEEEAVLREGVLYYPLMLSVGNMDDPEDDRLLYYDANLPRPDWKQGDPLTVTVHDKAVGAWAREA